MCNNETDATLTELRRLLGRDWSPETSQRIHPASVALLDLLRDEKKDPANSPERRLVNLVNSTKEPKQ